MVLQRCYDSRKLLPGQEYGYSCGMLPRHGFVKLALTHRPQNPPLYLHVTSTTKEGLDKAVAKIEELMKQELPQLVDERRFRRRDQEQQPPVERDEFGRVSGRLVDLLVFCLTVDSANGLRRRFLLVSSPFRVSTSVPKLWGTAAPTSSIFNKKPGAVCRSKAAVPDIWKLRRGERATRTCFCMLRKYNSAWLPDLTNRLQWSRPQYGCESQRAL